MITGSEGMKLYLALIILFPLLGGVFNAVAGMRVPRRWSEVIACSAVGASFACAVLAFLDLSGPVKVDLFLWLSAFDFNAPASLYFDNLAAVMCLMVTFVAGLIHVYSVAYMKDETDYVRFFALLNLFVFAMLVLVLADSLPLLYLGWEGVGFCSYALIGFWYGEEANATAGRKAFIVTRVGDVAFGVAIFWMFSLFGTVSVSEINQMHQLVPAAAVTGLGLLLLGGAVGKSAQIPLMVWLPDAMAGPTPVSALIHAATMVVAGVYLLGRFLPLIQASTVVMATIACIGAATAFYAATCALAQRDLKRILAYSTMSQIGYMILGVGCGAVVAATFHMLVHSFFKSLLFMGAGCIIAAMGHEQDIFRMGGLRRSLPLTFWPFLAGAACLAGVPPTGGFFSKDPILIEAFLKGEPLYYGLFVLAEVTAFLTAVYTFRMVYVVFGGEQREAEKVPRLMEMTLFPLAILAVFAVFFNSPEYMSKSGWLGNYMAPLKSVGVMKPAVAVEEVMQVIAAVISLAGLAVAHFLYAGGRWRARERALVAPEFAGFFHQGWYIDRLYAFLFVRPYERLSRFLWEKMDEKAFTGSLDAVSNAVGAVGQKMGRWSDGRISVYIASFAAGAALIAAYFAWLFF
jgi:NADH-quinone oxidoreductase subunit L